MRKETRRTVSWTPDEWQPHVKKYKLRQPHECDKCGCLPHISHYLYEGGFASWHIECPECGDFLNAAAYDLATSQGSQYLDEAIAYWNGQENELE